MVTKFKHQLDFNTHQSNLTLKESLNKILEDMGGGGQSDIPFIVWLLENPDSMLALPGKINLYNHDCLHILLDLGISLTDEAFVVGFTMGNDMKTSRSHLTVFKILSKLFYPKEYNFNKEQFKLFDVAFSYGRKLRFKNLNQIDFKAYEEKTVGELRNLFGINLNEVRKCFALV